MFIINRILFRILYVRVPDARVYFVRVCTHARNKIRVCVYVCALTRMRVCFACVYACMRNADGSGFVIKYPSKRG